MWYGPSADCRLRFRLGYLVPGVRIAIGGYMIREGKSLTLVVQMVGSFSVEKHAIGIYDH